MTDILYLYIDIETELLPNIISYFAFFLTENDNNNPHDHIYYYVLLYIRNPFLSA